MPSAHGEISRGPVDAQSNGYQLQSYVGRIDPLRASQCQQIGQPRNQYAAVTPPWRIYKLRVALAEQRIVRHVTIVLPIVPIHSFPAVSARRQFGRHRRMLTDAE